MPQLYHYSPSEPLAIVALVLFGVASILHSFQMFKKRSWFFIPFVIGGYLEVLGYLTRILSAQSPEAIGLYAVQSLLLLLPPIFFSATIYMTLKKIIVHAGAEKYSMISVKRLTTTFVWLDVISLFVQGSGGGMLAAQGNGTSTNLPTIGRWVTVVGLAIQIFAFTGFLFVAYKFQSRVRRDATMNWLQQSSYAAGRTIRVSREQIMYALYGSGALILIRSVYRIVEFVEGRDGYLMSHEAFFYVLDALMMLLVMVLYNIVYPASLLSEGQESLPLNMAPTKEISHNMDSKDM